MPGVFRRRWQPYRGRTKARRWTSTGVAPPTTTYDLTDTTVGGVFVSPEGGMTDGTFGTETAWGVRSSSQTGAGLRFVVAQSASPVTVEVRTWNNSSNINLAVGTTDVGSGNAPAGSSAYGWVTVATGFDCSAGDKDCVLTWSGACFVTGVRVTNGTLRTAYLAPRKCLCALGDSRIQGSSSASGNSNRTVMRKGAQQLGMQLANGGVGSTKLATGGSNAISLEGFAVGPPNPDLIVANCCAVNDAAAGTDLNTYQADVLRYLRDLRRLCPAAKIMVRGTWKNGAGDTTTANYNAREQAAVTAMADPLVRHSDADYLTGITTLHPEDAEADTLAALLPIDYALFPSSGGGSSGGGIIGG